MNSSVDQHKACHAEAFAWRDPPPKVVLWQPEIPQNTGNIARLCAGAAVPLHLVEPLGFALTSARVRRAGLDYWESVQLHRHADYAAFEAAIAPARCWLLSTSGRRSYTDVRYACGDALVFGSETRGLPRELLASAPERTLHIPIVCPAVRSINLANAVGIVLYEALRQLGILEGVQRLA